MELPYCWQNACNSGWSVQAVTNAVRAFVSNENTFMKKMTMKLFTAALLAIVVVATGCSSVMCGSKQTIPVTSKPSGAAVTVYDRFNDVVFQGTTPCNVTLARGSEDHTPAVYRVTVDKEGFAKDEIFLRGEANRAYLGNALN